MSDLPPGTRGTAPDLQKLSAKKSGTANIGKGLLLNTSSITKCQTPHLPNLLNNTSLQQSVRDPLAKPSVNDSILGGTAASNHNIGGVGENQPQSGDIMMLKRLNFLRNTL